MSFRRIALNLRATPLLGFVPAGALAVTMGIVAGQQPDVEHRYLPSRLGILAIVIAAGFVFDDPASPTSDPLPSPLRRRRFVRAAVAMFISSILFTLLLLFAADGMDPVVTLGTSVGQAPQPAPFPWGRLALETATMIGFVLAIAAASARRGQTEPGRMATGVLLGAYAVTWIVPESHNPWASPEDTRWDTGANWWWLALVIVWLLAVWLSWDSRVTSWPRRLRRTSNPPAGLRQFHTPRHQADR